MDYTTRRTQREDIPALQAFVKASWARTYDPIIGEDERRKISDAKHVPSLFEQELEQGAGVSFIAIDNKTLDIIGHAGGPIKSDQCVYIDRLHVGPEWWGQGVAHALLDAVGALEAVSMIELTVLEGNDRAFAFYMKYGFSVIEHRDASYGMGGFGDIVLHKPV